MKLARFALAVILCSDICHELLMCLLFLSNDGNVLTMGARVIGSELAKVIVDAWLNSEFAGGGSTPKVEQLRSLENQSFHKT